MNDVPVNIVEWYTYYSTHRNSEKRFFFLRKKILASWYFANQSGIVWGKFSQNKKKIIFWSKLTMLFPYLHEVS